MASGEGGGGLEGLGRWKGGRVEIKSEIGSGRSEIVIGARR